MKRIYLDVDGVLADFSGAVVKHYGIPDHPTESYWYWIIDKFKEKNPGSTESDFWEGLDKDFWLSIEETKEAREIYALAKWYGRGEEPILATSPSYDSAGWKQLWIRQHFPDVFYQGRYVLSPSKHLLARSNRVLVDDYYVNIDKWIMGGGFGILVPRPYNENRDKDVLDHIASRLRDFFYIN